MRIIYVGNDSYLQIQGTVIDNNQRKQFVTGELDQDLIRYLVLKNVGAGLTIDFG